MLNIGDRFHTHQCGDLTVIQKPEKGSSKYKIRFVKTGYTKDVTEWQIRSGHVSDPYCPIVLGIGIPGDTDYKKYGKLAALWRDIIYRCYDPKSSSYNRYGAKGVTVDKEWYYLPVFIRDVMSLPNFDWDLFNSGKLHLDKDLKQRYSQNKVYAKNTCSWLLREENVAIQDAHMKPFKVIDPQGNETIYFNISKFAREHADLGFTRKNVSAVLNRPDVHSCFGWKFEKINSNKRDSLAS